MKYTDGKLVKMGDRVKVADDNNAVVVCSIDNNQYSKEHPKAQWENLKRGVMIESPLYGLLHYEEPDSDLQFISRGKAAE